MGIQLGCNKIKNKLFLNINLYWMFSTRFTIYRFYWVCWNAESYMSGSYTITHILSQLYSLSGITFSYRSDKLTTITSI